MPPISAPSPSSSGVARLGRDGRLDIRTGDGDDDVRLQRSRDGRRLEVDVNGTRQSFLASRVRGVDLDTGGGNDRISLGRGVLGARVRTGDGDDRVRNRADGARIDVGGGDNRVRNQADRARVTGYDGNDTFVSTGDRNRLRAGNGDNGIRSTGDRNRLTGGNGTDRQISIGDRNRLDVGGNHSDAPRDRDRVFVGGNGNRVDARRSGNADLGIGERSRDNTLVLRGETVQGEDGKPRPVRRREVVELGEGNRLVVYPTARR